MTTILPAVDAAARRAVAHRTEQLFTEAGAFRTGHFALKGGRHSDRYLEKFQVLQFPAAVSELCSFISARVRGPDGQPQVDVVAGPTTGGVILAFEVARQLGVRGIFAEEVREGEGAARREFRRGFHIAPGERVLLVDDILTTGGSLLRMLPPVESADARLALAMVLVDRSAGTSELISPVSGVTCAIESLWPLALPTYAPGQPECPGCVAALPLETPGATGVGGGPAS